MDVPSWIERHSNCKFAFDFANVAHSGQVRKYTNEPYIVHPVAVAESVWAYGGSVNQLIAALLHDVVEDTDTTIEQIAYYFGDDVAGLVADLTDVSTADDGNRQARKDLDFQHTKAASDDAKFIKLADLMDNTKSIVEHDKQFAKTYLREKSRLLEVLKTDSNQELWNVVNNQLNRSMFRVLDRS